jgi:glycosyltransferase involved in cell wall biosynthesis
VLSVAYFRQMNFTQWGQWLFYSFCLVTLIQLFYFTYFFMRLAFYKAKPKVSSQTHPVSVIICARDEAANLAKNLPGALIQNYATTNEVIVVDDNSYDDTKYLLDEFKKEYKQLHTVLLTQEAKFILGKKFPLSIGIKTAKYEVLLLTDADCIPASEFWIDKMQQVYDEETEIVLGYGAYYKKSGLLNKIVRWETFNTALQYFSYALAGTPYMGVGRNLSYKKQLFFKHKGFTAHNHIASGDDDLFIKTAATKSNTKISIDPETFTLSEPATTWRQWINQKNRHYTTAKFYKPAHKLLLGSYALTQFLFYPLFAFAVICYSWQIVLVVFGIRFIVQAVIYYCSMKKLNEKDLFGWFLFFDIGQFFYYLLFSFSLIKKPQRGW